MLDERFHDEIDACRSGGRDLNEPEMSGLAEALAVDPAVRARYEAVQRCDARLTEAFAAVPMPTDLAARLLARLQQSTAPLAEERLAGALSAPISPESASSPTIVLMPPATALPRASLRRGLPRRRVLAALAASVLVATGLWARFHSSAVPASGETATEAVVWFEGLTDVWQPVADAPADLPLPAAIVGRPRGWQTLAKNIARKGVVYSLAQRPGARAALFVFAAKRPGLPATVPVTPQSQTGGLTIGAWQSQGLVYVLVVQGDERAYRRLLQPVRQPLA